jgi:hypothetical protein
MFDKRTNSIIMVIVAITWLAAVSGASPSVFNVKDFGTKGTKTENSRTAIQKAVDACAKAGGGTVLLPPGEYTSGTINLKSNVRLYLDAGAVLYATRDPKEYTKGLIFGENLENITLEGRGEINGQSKRKRERMREVDANFRDNTEMMKQAGKKLLRPYPVRPSVGLVRLNNCKNILIRDLSFINSSSWSIHPWGCERVVIEGVYIWTDLVDGCWADGIDPDCCRDVLINNCIIETGDDCISLKTTPFEGKPRPCRDVVITNCRLTSSSAAIKFGDEIFEDIKNVVISNCVITNSNRGINLCQREKGVVSDVLISNITMECERREWFWWGDGDPFYIVLQDRLDDPGHKKWEWEWNLGEMKNIHIRDVIAYSKGSSLIEGHRDRPLEGISFENVKIYMSCKTDSTTFAKAENCINFRRVKDLSLKGIQVIWQKPDSKKWKSALHLENIENLKLDEVTARQAHIKSKDPAILLKNVENAMVRACSPLPGTIEFIRLAGKNTRDIYFSGNNFKTAKIPYKIVKEVNRSGVKDLGNIMPK